jgi:hypothetical protein
MVNLCKFYPYPNLQIKKFQVSEACPSYRIPNFKFQKYLEFNSKLSNFHKITLPPNPFTPAPQPISHSGRSYEPSGFELPCRRQLIALGL